MLLLLLQGAWGGEPSGSSEPLWVPGELLVWMADDSDPLTASGLQELHRRWGLVERRPLLPPSREERGPHGRRLERWWQLRFAEPFNPIRAAEEYRRAPGVAWAVPNRLLRAQALIPNDPELPRQWNLIPIQAPEAWEIERGSPEVVVAVIDTGVDLSHPELRGRLWRNPGELAGNGRDDDGNGYVDDLHGWDFLDAPALDGEGDLSDPDPEPQDESGHGTHVAGILCAEANNGLGIAGVAWNISLMPLRAGLNLQRGGTFVVEDDIASAIVYAVENGAQVINMSFGDGIASPLLADAVRYAADRDVVLVGAAGNEGRSEVVYPAAFPEVIAVAASDQNDNAAYFTSATPEVDLTAPGLAILSLDLGGGLRTLSGTSMATPHVAGVAALLRSKRPGLSAEEVRHILRASGDPLHQEGRAVGVPRLNAFRALQMATVPWARLELDTSIADQAMWVSGAVGGPEVRGYRLEYGFTQQPTEWKTLTEREGLHQETRFRFRWETAALPEGWVTLRLEAWNREGLLVRDQRLVWIAHHELIPAAERIGTLWVSGVETGYWSLRAAEPIVAEFTFWHAETGEQIGPWRFGTPRQLFFLLPAAWLNAGTWTYHFKGSDALGRTVRAQGTLWVEERPINPHRFAPLVLAAPALRLAPVVLDQDGDGRVEIVGGSPSDSSLQVAQLYEWEGGALQLERTFPEPFVPEGALPLPDGRTLIAGTRKGALLLWEVGQSLRLRARMEGYSDARFGDLDGDGTPELVVKRGASGVAALDWRTDPPSLLAVGQNPSEGRNHLTGAPALLPTEDGSSVEIVAGDVDGDLILWRWAGSGLQASTLRAAGLTRINALKATAGPSGTAVAVLGAEPLDPERPEAGELWALRWYVRRGTELAPASVAPIRLLSSKSQPQLALSSTPRGVRVALTTGTTLYTFLWEEGRSFLVPEWVRRGREVGEPTFLPLGEREVLFFAQEGQLQAVFAEEQPRYASLPYHLQAEIVGSGLVRLWWRNDRPVWAVRVVRETANGRTTVLGDTFATELLDRSAPIGERVTYRLQVGETLADATEIWVASPPRLKEAAPLDALRVRLRFSEPMGVSATYAWAYRVVRLEGASVPVRSAVRTEGGRAVLLTLDRPLVPGEYRVEVVAPLHLRSRDGAPLDPAGAEVRLFVESNPSPVYSLETGRVYPNPVRPSRSHPARVSFDRLPSGTEVRIYSTAGRPVASGRIPEGEDRWVWPLVNEAGTLVAPGVYLYVLEWNGRHRAGKLAVIW
ncbi:MAG: hypothetical protein KatS3mg115_0076 [Candidatus Poribacteria bacterium]|nr:MAG: hypothetical protein KatS3mg115_0076 [Candidatus Poribacteria bacterium]